MSKIDTNLFTKIKENDILLVQIYVDDIIFDATNVSLCEEFTKCMHNEFDGRAQLLPWTSNSSN